MYQKMTIKDTVRVPPDLLGRDVEESLHKSLSREYEGEIKEGMGVILAVTGIDEIGDGEIRPEDAGVHYPVTYTSLVFKPELHEIVEGEVVEVTDFGAFVRIGPIDGLCHISQVMDDYVDYDEKQEMLVGKDGKRTLKTGDTVRARVTAVSLDTAESNKVNLTMRQPTLGKLEWVQEDLEEDEEDEEGDE
jgi:DNA-directed RNA polymerase subunit E'